MKRIQLSLVLSLVIGMAACTDNAQQGKTREDHETSPENKENRVSPATSTTADLHGNTVTVQYGSPRVKGRVIWGGLVPYGQVWRTGANEATTITFSQDVLIEGQLLKADTYSLFTIPEADQWIIIFNLEEKQWGAFKYDQEQDALRMEVTPVIGESLTENMTFTLEPQDNGGVIRFQWEFLTIDIPFVNAPAAG
ncbi:MAG TPA: DUF2911 domain-containing protein [Chitinophagales bacterium]|nr:DUF2911 domain-containing protein [Chitinophagales bacterium]HPR28817.1 DUF2911 domain-containing protein [Chitinophagales bacterium]HQU38449.1 DUF2911 domain-containing protein [Chitinophagales bacterium]HQU75660.1 DUF2911 domain-containing protein [Chitinophagales bacterium]HRX23727.1 DUF2911 domain-containing protein [Chitinophagales bacterium]